MLDQLVTVFDEWTKGGRAQDLNQLASENNFKFTKRAALSKQPTPIKGFKVFDKKGTKRLLGILEGELNGGKGIVRFYDYILTQDLIETTTRSIIEIYTEDLETDYFKIEPKGLFNRTKDLFKFGQKILPDMKAFHKKFRIQTDSEDASFILNRAALDLMLDFPKMTIEANGNYFLFYGKKKEMPVLKIMEAIDFAEEFVSLLGTGEDEGYV